MKVALQISATKSDHQFRGIGFYTKYLATSLEKIADKDFELVTFSEQIPKADLYHFPAFTPFFFNFPLQLVAKSVITIHDLIPLDFPEAYPSGIKGQLRWQIQRLLLPQAKHIITDSKASKQSILKHTSINQNKISVVYLGVNPDCKIINDQKQLTKIVKKFSLPREFVLYVGDLNWNKNVIALAQSCIDLSIPLVVVGKQALAKNFDPNHVEDQVALAFQKLAGQYHNLVRCLGYVENQDLVALYNLATMLVFPSKAEGFGLPVLDAMVCGCPVLTSSVSSLPEVGGDAVYYIDPFKKESLKKGLQTLWQDKKLRSKLSKKGLVQAQKFSWEKTAQEMVSIYRQVN
ncbi:glycosyltransferase family 4 protein [Candidatus Beckwithbacteria bacterium]|nr:glycosyltransferase family 4 protein [Candidatus Beckwithbacteria bacterium]